jgi:glycosyltransferase involved in cell wall biosynthesis
VFTGECTLNSRAAQRGCPIEGTSQSMAATSAESPDGMPASLPGSLPDSTGTVAFFIRALEGGGAQRDMILLANGVAAQGRRVEILTLVAEGPLRALVSREVAVLAVSGGKLRSALSGVRRALAARRPHAVVSAEAASNLLVLLAARSLPRRLRPRVILREVSSASVSQRSDPYRQTRLAYAILRFAYRWADTVVTLTDGALLDLSENFGVPRAKLVRMTSNAVIEDASVLAGADDGDRESGLVVAVGRLSLEKDQATLLHAFSKLPQDGKARLEIFGTGPQRPALEKLIQTLGLGDRVSLEGFVPDPFPVFRRAALLVSSSRFEGFGNVLVEAMSCGTPVVSTDCPYGPAEILDHGRYGQLVPIGDADAMARAIVLGLAMPPDRAALRARAAHHTVGRAGGALSAIIDSLVLRPSAHALADGVGRPQPSHDRGLQRNVVSDPATRLRCRVIEEGDREAIVDLLGRGFPDRPQSYWRRGLARHVARTLPAGHPRYGYLLEADGVPVGVLLTLHTTTDFRAETVVRCNLSSWYVDPPFRSYAFVLDRMSLRHKDVTFLNVTAAPHTLAIQEARGFARYCRGQMLAMPVLSRPRVGISIRVVLAGDPLADLPLPERVVVTDHLSYGCLCFVWSDGMSSRPLILQRRTVGLTRLVPRIRLPIFQLIYCRSLDDLPQVSSALGRLLLRRYRIPWILIDSDSRIRGLPGHFFKGGGQPKFVRSPRPVELGDLAYTELVLFGP